jgi:hypothetical protein
MSIPFCLGSDGRASLALQELYQALQAVQKLQTTKTIAQE